MEEMGVQLSVQIAKEIIKPAEQGKNWRQNFEVYQNSLNIVEAAGFGKVFFAPLAMGNCSKEPSDVQPQVLLGCARARQCVWKPRSLPQEMQVPVAGDAQDTCTVPSHAGVQLLQNCLPHLAEVGAEGRSQMGMFRCGVELELLFPPPKPDSSKSSGNKAGPGCFC